MRIRRFVPTSVAMGAAVFALSIASASTTAAQTTEAKTDTMPVSADVTKNCTIDTAPVAFGAYDVNATADLDKTGTVTVACTKGVAAAIALNGGRNGNRTMTSAGGEALSYELFYNGAPWDATNPVTYSSTTRLPSTLTVTGRIPKGQDVAAGAYSDDVTATVNF